MLRRLLLLLDFFCTAHSSTTQRLASTTQRKGWWIVLLMTIFFFVEKIFCFVVVLSGPIQQIPENIDTCCIGWNNQDMNLFWGTLVWGKWGICKQICCYLLEKKSSISFHIAHSFKCARSLNRTFWAGVLLQRKEMDRQLWHFLWSKAFLRVPPIGHALLRNQLVWKYMHEEWLKYRTASKTRAWNKRSSHGVDFWDETCSAATLDPFMWYIL